MKKLLLKLGVALTAIAGLTQSAAAAGYTVYAYNNTGWDTVNLYMWGDINNLNGEWPGMASTGTASFNNYQYLTFELGDEATGKAENLIFNNGSDQLGDYAFTINSDLYVCLNLSGVTKIDNPETFVPGNAPDNTPEYESFTIYAYDETGWDNLYLYMWGDVNDLTGEWPGMASTGSTTINGLSYLEFSVSSVAGLNENLIFNNGDNIQLEDYALTLDKDVYLYVTIDGVSAIDNPQTFNPGDAPVYNEYYFYVYNNTNWDNVYMYMWGDAEFAGEWPGITYEATTRLSGYDYLVFSVKALDDAEENLIFNNGNGVQLPDYNLTLKYTSVYLEITPYEVKAINPTTFVPSEIPDEEYLLFVRGTMNNWQANPSWALLNSEETPDIYSGTFEVAEGEVSFKIADANWGTYNFGAKEAQEFEVYSGVATELTLVNASENNDSSENLICTNWMGGKMILSFNLKTQELTIEGPDQPSDTSGVNKILSAAAQINGNTVKLAAPANITVYTISGSVVESIYTDFMDLSNLAKGLYIIKADGTQSIKIVVR